MEIRETQTLSKRIALGIRALWLVSKRFWLIMSAPCWSLCYHVKIRTYNKAFSSFLMIIRYWTTITAQSLLTLFARSFRSTKNRRNSRCASHLPLKHDVGFTINRHPSCVRTRLSYKSGIQSHLSDRHSSKRPIEIIRASRANWTTRQTWRRQEKKQSLFQRRTRHQSATRVHSKRSPINSWSAVSILHWRRIRSSPLRPFSKFVHIVLEKEVLREGFMLNSVWWMFSCAHELDLHKPVEQCCVSFFVHASSSPLVSKVLVSDLDCLLETINC